MELHRRAEFNDQKELSNRFNWDYLGGGFPIHSREQECIDVAYKSMHLKPGGDFTILFS